MPGFLIITAIIGVAAFVVQEALEVILSNFKNSSPTLGVQPLALFRLLPAR